MFNKIPTLQYTKEIIKEYKYSGKGMLNAWFKTYGKVKNAPFEVLVFLHDQFDEMWENA